MMRLGLMRNVSGSKPGPISSPPVISTSAVPRTSSMRGRHVGGEQRGGLDGASSPVRAVKAYIARQDVGAVGGYGIPLRDDRAMLGVRSGTWLQLVRSSGTAH